MQALSVGDEKKSKVRLLSLTRHKLQLTENNWLQNVTLVDSPGMIDSIHEGADRGYDFIQAVRWFAERADYVLIFFDPDKPGTFVCSA